MKISSTTIAAFLSIAGTTCGVNAGAMTALTNNMSRLQVQERRRHLEDIEDAVDTCVHANGDVCGLINLSRTGSSYSLSNGHHGRHLEEDCDGLQSEICIIVTKYPDCPCFDEFVTGLKSEYLCDDLSVDACNDIPCVQEQVDAYDCFFLCFEAVPCFDSSGYCSYDEDSKLWSGDYEECNGVAALCAECFPDAQCDDTCAQCFKVAPCFDSSGYCSYDANSKLWSGDYEECNGGAALCAECFPDALCTDDFESDFTAVPSSSPSAAPSYSPSEPSAGVTPLKSLDTFTFVTVVSACILFM